MKILYGYPYFPSMAYGNVEKMTFDFLERLRNAGIDITGFCLTIDPPSDRLTFSEIERLWKRGDKKILDFYESLQKALDGYDVFINSVGINLHPEFVKSLKCLTVFQCNDDPESSYDLSRPAAYAYDLCLVGNIAEIENYKSWGIKNIRWRPLGLSPEIYNSNLTEEDLRNDQRDIDLFMMIDKNYPLRKARLDHLERAFPDAHFYGGGWKRGFLAPSLQLDYLRRAKIGPNIHNSTGPINYRTFYLPANGVMQICDNKSYLGQIYKLNEEVVGFDSIKECEELCRYYLAHDEERIRISLQGWKRAVSDYNEITIFKRDIEYFKEIIGKIDQKEDGFNVIALKHLNARSLMYNFFEDFYHQLIRQIQLLPMRFRRKLNKIWGNLFEK
jgi:spore maturation protein CgeB